MRACAVNPKGALLAGINVPYVWYATYLAGGLLSGLAGVLLLNTTGLAYSSGGHLTTSAFGAAILFGLKGPAHAFAGGILIGIVEAVSTGFLPGAWATAVPLLFIFIVLASGRLNVAEVAGGRA